MTGQLLAFFTKHPRIYLSTLALLGLYATLIAAKPLNTWKATAWLVNYQNLGFIKRGLIGSIIPNNWYQWGHLEVLRWIFDGALAVCLLIIIIRFLSPVQFPLNRIKILWGLFCIVAPFTFMQIGLDVARTDHIFITLAILAALIYLFKPKAYIVTIAIFTLLPFIHEVAVFIAIPMYGMGWILFNNQKNLSVSPIAITILLVALTLCMLMLYGKVEKDATVLHQEISVQAIDFTANEAIAHILTRPLKENIEITMKRYPRRLIEMLGLVVFMIPLWILFREMHNSLAQHVKHLYWLPISALSILPMFILGTDIFRWIATAILNIWVLYTLFMIRFDTTEAFFHQLKHKEKWLYISIFASIWMGPIGIMSYFPDPFLLITGHAH